MSGSLYISKASCKRTRHCWMLHVLSISHPVACCWELLRKVLNWSNVELCENGRNNSQHCWELLRLFARSFSKFFALFYLLYLMPYWTDKHQTWGFFSVCTFWLWGPCVDNTRTCTESPTNTYDIKQQLHDRAFFCDFSIFREEPFKRFWIQLVPIK